MAQLRLIGAVAEAESGYKALVCIFLNGGNDANNLIVPSDTAAYADYAAARGALALPFSDLRRISPINGDGRTWGLHPAVPELQALFGDRRLALLANVGTLAAPTTKAQFLARSVPLPSQLFSHNDQQAQWQTSVPDRQVNSGWGGRLADLIHAFNENNTTSMSISLGGRNLFQTGNAVTQFEVYAGSVIRIQESGPNASVRRRAL